MRDSAARNWILSQPWREVLPEIEESEILMKILGANFRPDDPASMAAFTAQLGPEEQAAVSALGQQKVPGNAEEVSRDAWNMLERRELERRRGAILARIQGGNLTAGEVMELQKQILDLQKRLTDIARPFPRPAQ